MNIIFFGSDNFAVPSLKSLLDRQHKISCVVTQPDKKKGRHFLLSSTAIKTIAQQQGLKIYQPDNINHRQAISFLKRLDADLFVVVAYGQIFSQQALDIPKIFSLNVHASLLPKYRGAAPINWALINGEKVTGITVIKMVKKMDAGAVILQQQTPISDEDTFITLEQKLSQQAAVMLAESLKLVENKNYILREQDEGAATFAPKLKKADGLIDWNKSAQQIKNLIRGCFFWPGAFTYYKDKLLKIYRAFVCQLASLPACQLPGQIIEISKEGILVATTEGSLLIEELQIEGKKRMKAEEFLAGHKVSVGEILGKK